MRILVTGKNGQVAQSLAALASDRTAIVALGRPELDIISRSSVEKAIGEIRPDVVINAAAFTTVDRAETEVEAAFETNALGAENVALATAAAGLPIIHISTDYVFSGAKPEPYTEADMPGPTGVYGRSKLEGERAVADANPAHVILRTAWVYSRYGNNFLKTMLRLAKDRDVVRVVADQYGTPTYADDIAAGLLAVAATIIDTPASPDWRGVFHMVAGGETSWAGFADEIFAQSARAGGPSATVVPITTAEYPTPARRPANSRLDTTRFGSVFGQRLPEWRSGVKRCVAELMAAPGAD